MDRSEPMSLDEAVAQAHRVAREVAAPAATAVDLDARWPEESLRALADVGLTGLVIPVDHGGGGLGLEALARCCEALATGCASTAMCFGMHAVASAVLAARASPEQVERYLRPIAAGEHLTTLALSEPGTGAHFWYPETRLERCAGAYLVNGRKSFVTNGGHADSYVVSAGADGPSAPSGEFSVLVVDADSDGLTWGREWDGIGLRGNSSRDVTLRDVAVADAGLLGHEGEQFWYVFGVVAPAFLAAMAGTYVGVARAALEEARASISDRRYSHSGDTVAAHPVPQHRLGTLWAMVERSAALTAAAGRAADEGDPDALPMVASAKAEAGDTAVAVANEAMTLAGGRGFAAGGRLGRCLRDARAAPVMSPTNDLLRIWTGRHLLDVPLLQE